MRILHVGNDPSGAGGISSVIANHLRRSIPRIAQDYVVSYSPSERRLAAVLRWSRAIYAIASQPRGVVCHVHLSQRGSLLREGSLAVVAKLVGHPVVITLHGSGLLGVTGGHRLAARAVLSTASIVHGFGDIYRSSFRVSSKKWARIPNDVVVPPQVAGAEHRAERVLFLGEVGTRKGIDRVAEMLSHAQLPSSTVLTIAGPIHSSGIDYVNSLRSFAQVEILGKVPHEEALRLLGDSRLLIQPSRAEAYPMSVCEALANGCGVIATEVGALGELASEAGQLITTGEPHDLARAVESVMTSSAMQQRLHHSARSFAVSTLDQSVVSAQWAEIYSALTTKRNDDAVA